LSSDCAVPRSVVLALLGIARCRYVIAVAFKRGICLLVFVDGVSTVPRSVVLAPLGIARCRYVIAVAFKRGVRLLVFVDVVSAVRPIVVWLGGSSLQIELYNGGSL
jgi:hypothetical protein